MTKQTTIILDEGAPRRSLQVNEATENQIRQLIEFGYAANLTNVVRIAVREAWERQTALKEEHNMNAIERRARETGKWIVSEARRNPRLNHDYEFDTRQEAHEYIRRRNWDHALYGPNGEFEMWNGKKWL